MRLKDTIDSDIYAEAEKKLEEVIDSFQAMKDFYEKHENDEITTELLQEYGFLNNNFGTVWNKAVLDHPLSPGPITLIRNRHLEGVQRLQWEREEAGQRNRAEQERQENIRRFQQWEEKQERIMERLRRGETVPDRELQEVGINLNGK